MNHTEAVRRYINENPGKILDVQYVHGELFSHIEKQTFLKILKRLEADSSLSPVDKGVYYIGANTKDLDSAIFDFYTGEMSGMVTGDALYKSLGLSDYEPRFVALYSNKLPNGKGKTVGKYRLSGAKLYFTKEVTKLVSLLEIIQRKNQIVDLDYERYQETERTLVSFYSDAALSLILGAIPFTRGTIAVLEHLLNTAGIENQARMIAEKVN